MERKPIIVAQRLTELRESVHLSQAKLAAQFEGVEQPAIFRYENAQSFPPYWVLMQYADFFDVSLDYIFGRTDNPQGVQKYPAIKSSLAMDSGLEALMELCFTPGTSFNDRLKETIAQVLQEVKNE